MKSPVRGPESSNASTSSPPCWSGRKRKVTGRKSDEVERGVIRLGKIWPLPLLLWFFLEYGFDEWPVLNGGWSRGGEVAEEHTNSYLIRTSWYPYKTDSSVSLQPSECYSLVLIQPPVIGAPKKESTCFYQSDKLLFYILTYHNRNKDISPLVLQLPFILEVESEFSKGVWRKEGHI